MLNDRHFLFFLLRSRSSLGHSRSHWGQSSSSQSGRSQEHRSRSRVSTVIQPLRQNATEVVDLTVDEDGTCNLLVWNTITCSLFNPLVTADRFAGHPLTYCISVAYEGFCYILLANCNFCSLVTPHCKEHF